jgi:tRNA dimethylallyltransferase
MGTKVIVVTGPTCSGKTQLSILIAEKIPVEIISADSRQIYKYLDIGTAKPAKNILHQYKHHLIDELDPNEDYNVSRFEKNALKIIDEIIQRGNIPLVVGGSGLYIKGLVDGIFDSVDTDEKYMSELFKQKEKYGTEHLYNFLKKVSPQSAEKMLPQNWKRVMRALEVFHLTGKSIEEHQKNFRRKIKFEFVQYGLNWQRNVLYKNIERRIDEMIEAGFVVEVENVLLMGYKKNINSLNTVGYKEIISYINGEYSLERAIELLKRNTRRYAKRQMTWFNADKRIKWLNVSSPEDLNNIAEKIINEEKPNERKN